LPLHFVRITACITRQHSYRKEDRAVHLKVLRVLTAHPATAPEILMDCCSDRY